MSRIVNNRPFADKICRVRDPALKRRWAEAHPWCQACGHNGSEWGRPLQTHHIIGGCGRSDEACNFLRLCLRCHNLAEGLQVPGADGKPLPKITLAIALSIKRLRDPGEYDAARLTALHGRPLPEFESIPAWFWEQWPEPRPHSSRDVEQYRNYAQIAFDDFCQGMNLKARRIVLARLMGAHRLKISQYSERDCDELRERLLSLGRKS